MRLVKEIDLVHNNLSPLECARGDWNEKENDISNWDSVTSISYYCRNCGTTEKERKGKVHGNSNDNVIQWTVAMIVTILYI